MVAEGMYNGICQVDHMPRDYYTILGIARNASDKDLRQAYRRLARKYHPDVNKKDKDAEERFKEINAAYEVLADPEKRRKYDQFGENWRYADQFARSGREPGTGPSFWRSTGPGAPPFDQGDVGFGSLFDDLLRGRPRRGARTVTWDAPVEIPVQLTLEEAYRGATRIVQLPLEMGEKERRLDVKIPPGVDTGSRVHLPAGRGVDLYLVVTVNSHHRFTRKGADLYVDLPVSLVDAVLGAEQEVQTLEGKVMLTIPSESQNGQVFRLRSQGMPHLGKPSQRGDLFVTLRVVLPTNLTEREQQLFKELSRSHGGRSAKP